MRLLSILLLALATQPQQDIVKIVRDTLAKGDFATAESIIRTYEASRGAAPEAIEAQSWLGRAALAARQYDKAEAYAEQTRKIAVEQLAHRKLDAEPHLPLALGASIEVRAQAMAARGERSEAVLYLRRELQTYQATSIRARVQKNIHLLSLEGKPAPALDVAHWLGPKPPTLQSLRGKPILLFFWAHWCSDCKQEGPLIARLATEYASKGLVVIGPTQHYGYVAEGAEAPQQQETAYIESIRKQYYAALSAMPSPLSEENFGAYGASSTPTLVFIDRKGIVRLYHPGAMSYAELDAAVKMLLGS